MLYIFVFIIIFYLLFDKITRPYLNPYKLIMTIGKKGSGKTTYLTKIAIKGIKAGRTVYSTVEIPGTILFDCKLIGYYTFLPNSIVLIDEVGMIWDNRDFKNFKPQVRDFFKYQRQYRLTVYLFSQTFDVDLKLRNLTDEMYLLSNKLRVFSVARRIQKRLTISKGKDGQPSTLADDYEFAPLLSGSAIKITFIPRWQDYYKSYDPPYLPYIDSQSKWLEMSDTQEKMMYNYNFYKRSCIRSFGSFINSCYKFKDSLFSRFRKIPKLFKKE